MAAASFITMTRQDVEAGNWLDPLKSAWANGKTGLIKVAPEPSGDPELKQAIETMLSSNGSYRSGETVVIHARPAALAMACETAYLLQEIDISAQVVLGISSLAREVRELLEEVYGLGFDPLKIDPEALAGIGACYRELMAPIEADGGGHWIVPLGSSPDPDPTDIPAVDLFTKVASAGLAPIGMMRNDGRIVSHDIWLTPTGLDVERLNADLAPDQHWTLDEWRSQVFRSMAVSADELKRLALGIEGVGLTIEASLKGGTLRYSREDGTDFTYRVDGRPVILDCGRVGDNSLGGTEAFSSVITNQPTTEVFVAPIEDSASGVIVFTVPERAVHGIIQAPYRIEMKAGRVVGASAPDKESERILRHYTGLEQYDGLVSTGDEKSAFDLRRVIAEMAIAGFNPVQLPEIKNGRLRPVTGQVLIDEKLGDHQAFGSNDQFKGINPSSIGDHHVEHTDFVGSVERKVELLG